MKISHLITYDFSGAGIAAIRINNAVKNAGIESEVFTLEKLINSDCSIIDGSIRGMIKKRYSRRFNDKIVKKNIKEGYFHIESFGGLNSKSRVFQDADIIHLHWINDGIYSPSFFSVIKKLGIPVVWTLHDMWPFTGGCHYDSFCGKYIDKCTDCPYMNKSNTDQASRQYDLKADFFSTCNVQAVGCSEWISNEFNKCLIGSKAKRKCVTIHNPINKKGFRKIDMNICREVIGVPRNKKLILFGAVSSTSDKRKGFAYLKEALSYMNPEDTELMVFGNRESIEFSGVKVHAFDSIEDELHLALIYNAADCFVAPSVQENLANTVVEALSCGTPVVAFDIGGMSDMVESKKNGYLAEPYSSEDLATGIKYCIDNREQLSEQAVIKVEKEFDENIIGIKYRDLYLSLV